MALVNCTECGESVSTKANACPNCGAKPPKQTSALTKFIAYLMFIPFLLGIIVVIINPTSTTTYSNQDPVEKTKKNKLITNSAEFRTLQDCLLGIKANSGSKLKIVTDKPNNVSGFLSNDQGFGCIEKTTGTKGRYFEGWYMVEDK
jgi:hypothetical protein